MIHALRLIVTHITHRSAAPARGLCLLCTLSCAAAPPPAPPTLLQQEAEVDIPALVARDALDEEGHPLAWRRVELNGAPPAELIILARADAAPHLHKLWVYDVQQVHDPRPIQAPPGADDWRSWVGGWWLADDLDRDGRAEIVIAAARRVAPHPDRLVSPHAALLKVMVWDDARGMVDRLWREPDSPVQLVVDVDGDGRRELVSVAPNVGGEPTLSALHRDDQGWWRPMQDASALWLPRVLEAIVARSRHDLLPTALRLMRLHRAAPRELPALQRQLAAQLAEGRDLDEEARRALCDAMAWEGNLAAYDVLLPMLQTPRPTPAFDALLALDASNRQTRGAQALLGWLKEALRSDAGMEIAQIARLLQAMAPREEGAALVAATLADEARALDARVALLRASLPYMSSQRDALWGLRGALRDALLDQLIALLTPAPLSALLGGQPPYSAEASRWRAALDAAQVEALMAQAATRVAGMRLALRLDPPRGEAVAALFDQLVDAEARGELIADMTVLQAAPPDLARLMRWLGRAPSAEQRMLVTWVMQSEDTALQLHLLDQIPVPAVVWEAWRAVRIPRCEAPAPECRRGALQREQPALHVIVARWLRSSDEEQQKAAVIMMGSLSYEPTQRLLLEFARRTARADARSALLRARSPVARDYILELLLAHPHADLLAAFAAMMSRADAQQLADSLLPADNPTLFLRMLSSAAPRACPHRLTALEILMDVSAPSCEGVAGLAAQVLALCSPEWLSALPHYEALRSCDQDDYLLSRMFDVVVDRGEAAHLPALEALREDARGRPLRDMAQRAAVRLRARLQR